MPANLELMKNGFVPHEHITLDLTPATIERLEPAVRKLAEEEWEDERVGQELLELANNLWSRLERIKVGDLQVSA